MNKWDTWRGLIPPPNPTFLTAVMLFGGVLLLIPNGMDAREQRYVNLAITALFCISLYAFTASESVGAFLLYVTGGFFFQGGFDMMNVHTILLMAAFYLVVAAWEKKINIDVLYDALCVFALLNVVWQVLEYFEIYIFLHPSAFNHLSGLMSNTNDLAALYACLIPAFFRKDRWPLAAFPLMGIATTIGRGGIIAVTVATLAFALLSAHRRSFLIVGGLALFLSVAFFVFVKPIKIMEQSSYRFYAWGEAIRIGMDKPLVGWGMGQFRFVMPFITSAKYLTETDKNNLIGVIRDKPALVQTILKIKKKDPGYFGNNRQQLQLWIQAHNEYVETFVNIGLIGLLVGLLMLLRHLWLGLFLADHIPVTGLLAACVTSFFHFSWHLIPIAIVTVFYMAIIKARSANDSTKQPLCV